MQTKILTIVYITTTIKETQTFNKPTIILKSRTAITVNERFCWYRGGSKIDYNILFQIIPGKAL